LFKTLNSSLYWSVAVTLLQPWLLDRPLETDQLLAEGQVLRGNGRAAQKQCL